MTNEIPADPTPPQQPVVTKTPMRVGFVGALVAVAGLGGFAVKTALSEPAGPQSPEEAAAEFFEAMGNEDIIGMAEVWLPSEREAYVDPSLALIDELERVNIFGEGVEVDSLGTLDIIVEGIEFSSTPLAPGFASVRPTTGTVSVVGTSDDVPVIKVVKEWLEEEPDDYTRTDAIVDSAPEDDYIVAVEHDGSWYLSFSYTVAESMRLGAGEQLPAFGEGPFPVGGATPERAIENFVSEFVAVDLEGMLTQLDPEEMRALYDYAPLFIDDGQEVIDSGLRELHDAGATWDITNLDLRSEDRRGRTVVIVEGFTLSGSTQGVAATLDFHDRCVSVKVSGRDLGEIDELFCEGEDLEQVQELDTLPDFVATLENLEFDSAGVTVIERDGRWYISTVPSILYLYIDVLVALEPSDVDDMKEGFQELRDFVENGMFVPEMFSGADSDDGYDDGEDESYEDDDQGYQNYLDQEKLEQELIDEEEAYQMELLLQEQMTTTTAPDYVPNMVEPDAAWVPDGYEHKAQDIASWLFNPYHLEEAPGVVEPISVYSVNEPGTFNFVEAAAYVDAAAAHRALQHLVDTGHQQEALEHLRVEVSGRFVVMQWIAESDGPEDPEGPELFRKMLAHLADL